MRIGLITDTHMPSVLDDLWPEVAEAFAGVDLVWHGGDIFRPMVLDQLDEIAPTVAARGNNDAGVRDPRIAEVQRLEVEGYHLAMVHDMEPEHRPIAELRDRYLGGQHADVMITGHTHYERMDWRDGVLQINSGSPTHPHQYSLRLGTVAVIEVDASGIRADIIRLGESEGLRNPGTAHHFDGNMVHRIAHD